MINIYYLYFHLNPLTNQVFYIGIGTNKRAWEFNARNKHWLNYVNKYGSPIVNIIESNLTKEEACVLEQQYIKKYGRLNIDKEGILLNKSEGGQGGTYGYKWNRTAEQKEKISNSLKGKNKNEEHKLNISKSKKGKVSSKLNQGKSILQYDKQNNLIKEWNCVKQVAEYFRGNPRNIYGCLDNINKTAYGYFWKAK